MSESFLDIMQLKGNPQRPSLEGNEVEIEPLRN